jgi:ethanolamine utilization cobalamin adenosyltransferase
MMPEPTNPRRAAHTLREQLAMMRELEILIAQKRIEESYQRIIKDADEALDIKRATSEGGQ